MSRRDKKTIVIAVGGSLLVPDDIDISFIKELKKIVEKLIRERNMRVVLSIGGGKTTRRYQAALREFSHVTKEDLDWVGIKSVLLNAELVLRAFLDLSPYPKVLEQPEDFRDFSENLFIVGGHEPGFSSDTDAVLFAEHLGADEIINFSNTDYVYDKDPRKYPDAKRLTSLTWDAYRSLIPHEWTPGLSTPFDPIASERAQKLGMRVAILGASLENLEHYLNGETFEGTIIE